jgi:hypothetical protein
LNIDGVLDSAIESVVSGLAVEVVSGGEFLATLHISVVQIHLVFPSSDLLQPSSGIPRICAKDLCF